MEQNTALMILNSGKDSDLLRAVADIVGKKVTVHRRGQDSAGDVVIVGESRMIISPRISSDDVQEQGAWRLDYSIDDNGRMAWAWLGHKLLGPCYQLGSDGWRNCYSHGDFGKNYGSGGTWSSAPEYPTYQTLAACVDGRRREIHQAFALNAARPALFVYWAALPGNPPVLTAGV